MMKLTELQVARVKWLEDKDGRLTAAQVLADAKQEDSPLHDLFEWDQQKAAESAWLDQARQIIRTVKVVVTTETTTLRAPYYTRDPDAVGQGYRSVIAMQQDPVAARQAVIDELTRAAGCIARAQHVALVLNLSAEVEQMLQQIIGLRQMVEAEVSAVATEAQPS